MNEPAIRTETVEAELLNECEQGHRGCTGDAQLVENPYAADVMNTPDQMIWTCDNCLEQIAADI